MAKARLALHNLHAEAPRCVVEVGHYVLALVGLSGILPGLRQRCKAAHFSIHANRAGTLGRWRQAVGSKVIRAFQKGGYYAVDLLWVNHRAIGGDAHDHVGIMFTSSLVIAVQDVELAATKDRHCLLLAKRSDRVIRRVGSGGDHHPSDGLGAPDAVDHPCQHRLPAQVAQDFAGQPAGAHAGLYDGDDIFLAHKLRRLQGCGVGVGASITMEETL